MTQKTETVLFKRSSNPQYYMIDGYEELLNARISELFAEGWEVQSMTTIPDHGTVLLLRGV